MTRAGIGALVLALGALLSGCSSQRWTVREVGAPGAACAFEPVSIRVHPLTRVVMRPDHEPRIDAHIEMRDAAGDEVKGTGRLALELYRGSGPFMGGGVREQVLRWETDLSDLDANSRAFDRVTRTYRFELTGLPETPAEKTGLRLRVVLRAEDGRELADEVGLER